MVTIVPTRGPYKLYSIPVIYQIHTAHMMFSVDIIIHNVGSMEYKAVHT